MLIFIRRGKKTYLEFHCKVVVSGLLMLAAMKKLVWCGEATVRLSATAFHKVEETCALSITLEGSVTRAASVVRSFTALESSV